MKLNALLWEHENSHTSIIPLVCPLHSNLNYRLNLSVATNKIKRFASGVVKCICFKFSKSLPRPLPSKLLSKMDSLLDVSATSTSPVRAWGQDLLRWRFDWSLFEGGLALVRSKYFALKTVKTWGHLNFYWFRSSQFSHQCFIYNWWWLLSRWLFLTERSFIHWKVISNWGWFIHDGCFISLYRRIIEYWRVEWNWPFILLMFLRSLAIWKLEHGLQLFIRHEWHFHFESIEVSIDKTSKIGGGRFPTTFLYYNAGRVIVKPVWILFRSRGPSTLWSFGCASSFGSLGGFGGLWRHFNGTLVSE